MLMVGSILLPMGAGVFLALARPRDRRQRQDYVVGSALAAAVLALASSFRDRPVPHDLAAIGEVGLTGELRSVNALGQRLSEVRRLGFTKCLIPARTGGKLDTPDGLQLIPVRNIREALAALL